MFAVPERTLSTRHVSRLGSATVTALVLAGDALSMLAPTVSVSNVAMRAREQDPRIDLGKCVRRISASQGSVRHLPYRRLTESFRHWLLSRGRGL
jgi:hypothetical protein